MIYPGINAWREIKGEIAAEHVHLPLTAWSGSAVR
jgi:hypothetical protein